MSDQRNSVIDQLGQLVVAVFFAYTVYAFCRLTFWLLTIIAKGVYKFVKWLGTQVFFLIGIAYWSMMFGYRKFKYRLAPLPILRS